MRRGRLRDAQVEPAAGHLALACETPHDAPPNGVGERVQDGGKIELRRARVRQRLHVSSLPGLFDNSRTSLYDDHRTYVREPSYMKEGVVDHSSHSYLGSRADRRIALHDHAGQPDRALDPAVDAARSRGVPRSAAVGRRRLHPLVRRPHAHRRRAGRPLRPASHARRRAARVHGLIGRGRARQRPDAARRRTRRPGPRRRVAHAAHADAAVGRLPAGAPHGRARSLVVDRRARRRSRAPARRRHRRDAGLALDLLDQRSRRPGRGRARPPPPDARAAAPRYGSTCRAWHSPAVACSGSSGPRLAATRTAGPRPRRCSPTQSAHCCCGAFIWQERRSAAPMLPLALFRRPGFAAANGAGFGLHFTMFAAFFLIIQYLTQVHGDSALAAGVETLPWTLLPLAVSPFTGALGGRIGSRPLIVAGLLLLAAGTAGRCPRDGRRRELRRTGRAARRDRPRNRVRAPERRLRRAWIGTAGAHRQGLRHEQHVPPAGLGVRHRRRSARVRSRRLLQPRPRRSSTACALRSSWPQRAASSVRSPHSGSPLARALAAHSRVRRAPRTPLPELEARQRHAARAARVQAARRSRSDETRGDQAKAAVGDDAVRQAGHADQTAAAGTSSASRRGWPADPADRRRRPGGAPARTTTRARAVPARLGRRGTAAQAVRKRRARATAACAR